MGKPNHKLRLLIGAGVIGALSAFLFALLKAKTFPPRTSFPSPNSQPPFQTNLSKTKSLHSHLAWALGILSLTFMLYAGYRLRWEKGQPFEVPTLAMVWLGLGALTLLGSMWLNGNYMGSLVTAKPTPRAEPIVRKWLLLGIAALLLLAEINANFLLKNVAISQHVQALLLVGGIAALIRASADWHPVVLQSFFNRANIPLFLIILGALAIRSWNISDAVHIMIDELHFFDAVNHLRSTYDAQILLPMNHIAAFPYTYAYLQNWTVTIFGTDFTGMRMASAVVGTLTIPALYLFAKELFDRKTALIAAGLLAVFPPHIHFSRLALNNIADPLFGTLAFAFLVRALIRSSQRDYVLAGINLGLSSYFYEGGRLLFLGLFVCWGGAILLLYRSRNHWRGLATTAFITLLVVMPYYYTHMRPEFSLTARFDNEAIRPRYLLQDLQTKPPLDVMLGHYNDALKYAFFHTIYSPDDSQFYYGGYTAILPWYVVPFYALGLFYLLWTSLPRALLLWFWLGFSIIGISFVVSTDWTVRYVVMFPAMMLAVTVGIRYPLEFLWPTRVSRRFLNGFIALVVALIGVFQLSHYFGDHLTYYNWQVRQNALDFFDVYDRASRYSPNGTLYYLSDEVIFTPVLDAIRKLSNFELGYQIWRSGKITRASLQAVPRDRVLMFAVVPTDARVVRLLQNEFQLEGPVWSNYESVPDDRQYALYLYKPAEFRSKSS
jgi:4-amino-4-deoxy-L-arabinose transferase-like glycosyltransferase